MPDHQARLSRGADSRLAQELKAKLRKEMGWPDRRSWTEAERKEIAALYTMRPDHQRGDFVALRNGEEAE